MKQRNILIVDDDKNVGKMLSQALTGENFAVDWVKTCSQARKFLRIKEHDLYIVDIRLPDDSGTNLAQQIKKKYPNRDIILITGGGELGTKGYTNMAKRIGIQHVFTKPFNIYELLEVIFEFLD